MLTKQEESFLEFWEKNRDNEKKFLKQLAYGWPWGLVFALPVLVVVIFHDWYKNMVPISKGQIILIIITVLAIAIFYAAFRMRFRWEHNEQAYKELKFKKQQNDAADL